ncbi:MAG: hypothetical protein MI919_38435, partial [Holophagales bacterium]|nr:hypothetical protein [Holophagales bacterium]
PGTRALLLAAGHEGLGITTALGTARLVVDRVLGRESEIDPSPYLPSREAPSTHFAEGADDV